MKYYIYIGLFITILASCSRSTTETYERFYFRTDGADLAVQVDGNRASNVFILLLHGGPGGSGFEYNSGLFTERMEERYAMVYLDQRGQGASRGNYSLEDVTLQQFSDDVYALSRFLKQKYGEDISLFLMGHSWGGTTGTHALLNTDVQNEINGWMEVDGAHDIPLLNKEAIKMYIEIGNQEIANGNNTERWQEIVDFASGVDTNNITVDEGGQINSYGFEAEGLIADVAEGSGEASPSHGFLTSPIASVAGLVGGNLTANAILEETEAAAMTSEMSKITIPTLFLWGKYDFVVPPALAFTGFEQVNTTEKEVIIFDYSGHSPMDNEPEAFADAVEQFVEKYK